MGIQSWNKGLDDAYNFAPPRSQQDSDYWDGYRYGESINLEYEYKREMEKEYEKQMENEYHNYLEEQMFKEESIGVCWIAYRLREMAGEK